MKDKRPNGMDTDTIILFLVFCNYRTKQENTDTSVLKTPGYWFESNHLYFRDVAQLAEQVIVPVLIF